MTIRPSIDIATRVSAGLSALLAKHVADPDRETPPTLGDVRRRLLRSGASEVHQSELLDSGDRDSLVVELDRLIEEFGPEAPAFDFIAANASEGLSRVIDAALEDQALPEEPTLGAVRDAMAAGLIARLAGSGAIDEEDDSALLAEIDELIRRFGRGVPAETFMRFE